MFCPNCGRPNAETSNFCKYCGQRLKPDIQPEPTPPPQPEPSMQQPDADFSVPQPDTEYREYPPNAAFGAAPNTAPTASPFSIKSAFAAPAVLVALIAASAALLFSLFGMFTPSSLYDLFEAFGVDGSFDLYAPFYSVSSMFGSAPSILILIGSWITYSSAANRGNAGISTGGLVAVRVGLIMQLVCVCLLFALLEFILVIATIMVFLESQEIFSMVAAEDVAAAGVLLFLLFFVTAILVMMIVYYVQAFKTVGVMRETAATGVPSDRISSYVAVIRIIAGGFTALSVFSALFFGGLFNALSSVCSAVASISFGVFLLGYRSKMRALWMETRQSAAQQPFAAGNTL